MKLEDIKLEKTEKYIYTVMELMGEDNPPIYRLTFLFESEVKIDRDLKKIKEL